MPTSARPVKRRTIRTCRRAVHPKDCRPDMQQRQSTLLQHWLSAVPFGRGSSVLTFFEGDVIEGARAHRDRSVEHLVRRARRRVLRRHRRLCDQRPSEEPNSGKDQGCAPEAKPEKNPGLPGRSATKANVVRDLGARRKVLGVLILLPLCRRISRTVSPPMIWSASTQFGSVATIARETGGTSSCSGRTKRCSGLRARPGAENDEKLCGAQDDRLGPVEPAHAEQPISSFVPRRRRVPHLRRPWVPGEVRFMDQPVREEVDYRVRLSKNRVAAVVSCHLTSKLLTFHGYVFLALEPIPECPDSAAVQESEPQARRQRERSVDSQGSLSEVPGVWAGRENLSPRVF